MNSEVRVTITGFQLEIKEDGCTDKATPIPIKTVAEGKYVFKNHKHYIIFNELYDPNNKKTGINNTIIIDQDNFQIIKSGYVKSRLSFTQGEKYATSLVTPMGIMYMLADTKKVQLSFMEDTIKLLTCYDLSLNDTKVSSNVVEILIENISLAK